MGTVGSHTSLGYCIVDWIEHNERGLLPHWYLVDTMVQRSWVAYGLVVQQLYIVLVKRLTRGVYGVQFHDQHMGGH